MVLASHNIALFIITLFKLYTACIKYSLRFIESASNYARIKHLITYCYIHDRQNQYTGTDHVHKINQ